MAKILQIRRGTTAQNDNFTGLPGELTFDTETKQLRVHDGEMLGGYVVTNNGNTSADTVTPFDITTVSDEFWQSMLERVMPGVIHTRDSNNMPISNGAYLEYIFNVSGDGLQAIPILVCVDSDAGYNIGEEVYSFGIGANTVMTPNLYRDTYGLHARLFIGGADFWVANKTTGIQTNIIPENWRIKFRLYY